MHVWPHDVVSEASQHLWPDTPGFEFGHWDQTFEMYQEGMVQKILFEHEKDLPTIALNKLRYQSYLICQSYVLDWKYVLGVAEKFFEAYETNVIDWSNWDHIEKFLQSKFEQARMSALAKIGTRSFTGGAAGNTPRLGAPPTKPKADSFTKGVSWKYMKSKGICCGFNAGSCGSKGAHKIGDKDVNHYCGGCFFDSKGASKLPHPCKECGKGPWDKNLFA